MSLKSYDIPSHKQIHAQDSDTCHFITFSILTLVCGGWGNTRSSEKHLHHFCFWHPLLFGFNIMILSSAINGFFLPSGLKKIVLHLTSPSSIT